jgi:hypothetical protein
MFSPTRGVVGDFHICSIIFWLSSILGFIKRISTEFHDSVQFISNAESQACHLRLVALLVSSFKISDLFFTQYVTLPFKPLKSPALNVKIGLLNEKSML